MNAKFFLMKQGNLVEMVEENRLRKELSNSTPYITRFCEAGSVSIWGVAQIFSTRMEYH
jgi:hypothetical protein